MQKRRNPEKAEQGNFLLREGSGMVRARVQDPLLKEVSLSSALPFARLPQNRGVFCLYLFVIHSFIPIPFPDVADLVKNLVLTEKTAR